MSASFEGWLQGIGRLSKVPRMILLPAGLLLMTPGNLTDLLGLSLGVIVILAYVIKNRKIKANIADINSE